jgi:glycosyltransferase involved in cell wall biosynthesis
MLALAEGLTRRGHQTELICLDQELARVWSDLGLGPATLAKRPARPDRVRELISMAAAIRTARPVDATVCFSIDLMPLMSALRVRPTRRFGVLALDLHDHLSGARGQRLLRFFAGRIDVAVAVSRFVAHDIGDVVPVRVLTRPVSGSPARTRGDGKRLVAGVVGRIDAEKGHRMVVDALAQVPDARLVVRGDAAFSGRAFADDVLGYARDRLGEAFDFQGRVPPERAMDDLDVLVVANPAEPMGRTVLEAQLAGVVAVVPDTGGSAELVEEGVTGFVYRADDPASLASCLTRLAVDPELRESVTEAARTAARKATDVDAYAAAYLDALMSARTVRAHA